MFSLVLDLLALAHDFVGELAVNLSVLSYFALQTLKRLDCVQSGLNILINLLKLLHNRVNNVLLVFVDVDCYVQ